MLKQKSRRLKIRFLFELSVLSVCNVQNYSPFRYSLVLVYMPVCAE